MKKLFRPFLIFYIFKHIWRALWENPLRFVVYGIVIVLFTVEVLIYYYYTFSWYTINCKTKENCTKILLVADPQLIGLHREPYAILTPVSIWDSDKYLAKTFSYAFKFTKPDVIIFLGDLFDEGSSASDDEFELYHNRLQQIFMKKQFQAAVYIWLSGDNDIGGEGNDWITEHKVRRFENTFKQPSMVRNKNSQFYIVNEVTSFIPQADDLPHNPNRIICGLSHIPLLIRDTTFVKKVIKTLKPHLFLTAHSHESMVVEMSGDTFVEHNTKQKVYHCNLGINNTVYEITVPTCSYRMGTDKIGYGFAVIENKAVRYTVLWSPRRFPQIRVYIIVAAISTFVLLLHMCTTVRKLILQKT